MSLFDTADTWTLSTQGCTQRFTTYEVVSRLTYHPLRKAFTSSREMISSSSASTPSTSPSPPRHPSTKTSAFVADTWANGPVPYPRGRRPPAAASDTSASVGLEGSNDGARTCPVAPAGVDGIPFAVVSPALPDGFSQAAGAAAKPSCRQAAPRICSTSASLSSCSMSAAEALKERASRQPSSPPPSWSYGGEGPSSALL